MWARDFFALTVVVVVVTATSVVHDRTAVPPHTVGWMKSHRAPADALVQLTIGLRQREAGLAALQAALLAASDTTSPSYGQHLSQREVDTLVAPHADSVHAVAQWLVGAGLKGKDLMVCRRPCVRRGVVACGYFMGACIVFVSVLGHCLFRVRLQWNSARDFVTAVVTVQQVGQLCPDLPLVSRSAPRVRWPHTRRVGTAPFPLQQLRG